VASSAYGAFQRFGGIPAASTTYIVESAGPGPIVPGRESTCTTMGVSKPFTLRDCG
jgi:hypothetical protein